MTCDAALTRIHKKVEPIICWHSYACGLSSSLKADRLRYFELGRQQGPLNWRRQNLPDSSIWDCLGYIIDMQLSHASSSSSDFDCVGLI
jgi:hypothetical protein